MQSFMVSSFAYLWLLRLPVPKVGSQLVPSFGTSMNSSRNNEELVLVALGDDAFGSVPTSKYLESVSLQTIQDCFNNEAL
jgi:hypothetical protein